MPAVGESHHAQVRDRVADGMQSSRGTLDPERVEQRRQRARLVGSRCPDDRLAVSLDHAKTVEPKPVEERIDVLLADSASAGGGLPKEAEGVCVAGIGG